MIRWLVVAIGFCIAASPVLAADPIEIGIGYLGRAGVKAKLSLVELPAENDGVCRRTPCHRGQQHHGKIPQSAFHAGGSPAEGQ